MTPDGTPLYAGLYVTRGPCLACEDIGKPAMAEQALIVADFRVGVAPNPILLCDMHWTAISDIVENLATRDPDGQLARLQELRRLQLQLARHLLTELLDRGLEDDRVVSMARELLGVEIP